MTAGDADEVMRDVRRMGVLEEVARSLRDAELGAMRASAASSAPVVAGGEAPERRSRPTCGTSWRPAWSATPGAETGEARAALIAGTGANGGFLVPEPIHAPLIEKYRKQSPLFQDGTVFTMNGNTTMYLPFKATHGAVASTTETGARTEQTEPTFTGGPRRRCRPSTTTPTSARRRRS